MSGMDVLNISVGVISLILGGFAIWLSVYFFIKAKESEKETAKTLEAIRTQSDALQKLTGKWMDRFTRYATEPKPADEGLMMLVNTMANLPTTILTHLRVHTTTEPAPSNEALFGELTDCYMLSITISPSQMSRARLCSPTLITLIPLLLCILVLSSL